mgnify:CR=1 FL=1
MDQRALIKLRPWNSGETTKEMRIICNRKSNFAKLNTDALFKAVDADNNGAISEEEWIFFWEEVKRAGHTDKEISEEVRSWNRV